MDGHGFHFFELQVREHIACVLAAPTVDTRFRSLLREVHRGRLCALFDVDCIFVVGRGAKFHGAKVRFVVVGELGLALVSAQVHGAAGGKRHEVRAVVAEDRAFVGAVGRGLQLPSAVGGAVCRDVALAVVRFDLEEQAFLGHIQFIEPVVGLGREELLIFLEREGLVILGFLYELVDFVRHRALSEFLAQVAGSGDENQALHGCGEQCTIVDVVGVFDRPSRSIVGVSAAGFPTNHGQLVAALEIG